MSKSIIALTTLLREVVNEVGDLQNIQPLLHDISKGTFTVPYKGKEYRGKVTFTFLNTKGLSAFDFPPVVDLQQIKTGYNVGYSIEGISSQFIKADTKLLLSILKTVSIVVADHVEKHPNSIHVFFGENKTGIGMEDPQKLAMYGQILGKNLPQGYRMGEVKLLQEIQGLFICKK
jgi:hypothetical protein